MADGSLVSNDLRNSLRARVEPFARGLGRVGLTPNAVTVLGFLVAAIGGLLAGLQLWFAAGVIATVGAVFDMLDGALARATGTTSKLGAFLDSTFDRWGEAAVYVGVAAGAFYAREPLTAVLAGLAMSSAFMVSYTRAKAESLGFTAEVGIAPRPERVVILGVGLVACGLAGGPVASPWLQVALGILFVISTVTVVQRVLAVRAQSRASEVIR
jgi:CDP-diacylglycerol--glycerol-3-phosphate 3-phosphatidyltransferase